MAAGRVVASLAGESDNVFGGNAGEFGSALRRPFAHAFLQVAEPEVCCAT